MDPDSTLASYLRTVCPDADLSGVSPEALAFAAAMDVVGEVAPEIATAVAAELADQRSNLKLIASRELRLAGDPAGHGQLAVGQVRRGLSRSPLLRRLRQRRRHRGPGRGAGQGPVRRDHAYVQPHSGADANLVAFLVDPDPAGRGAGAGAARRRRTSKACPTPTGSRSGASCGNQRLLGLDHYSGGHLTHGYRHNVSGKLFEVALLQRRPRDEAARPRQLAQAGREVRPLILLAGYSAYPRKINFARCGRSPTRSAPCSWSTWPTSPGWSRARSSPATSTRSPTPTWSPPPRTRRCAARAAAWCCAPRSSRRRRQGLPGCPGRTAAARHGRQGGRAAGGVAAGVRRLCRSGSSTTPPRLAEGCIERGHGGDDRRHRQPPAAGRRRASLRPHRPAGRVGAARLRHHPQPQLAPVRRQRPAGTPAACASAPRPSRPSAWAPTRCARSPPSSTASSTSTQPVPDSKARYTLDPSTRDQAKRRAGDLLDRFPLYPGDCALGAAPSQHHRGHQGQPGDGDGQERPRAPVPPTGGGRWRPDPAPERPVGGGWWG